MMLQNLHTRTHATPSPSGRSIRSGATGLCVVLAALALPPRAAATPLDDCAETYRRHLVDDIGQALTGARNLRERIAAADLDGAREAWIAARVGWERSEVFTAGFVPELDREIDAWPNATHGFHGIEAGLFGASRADVGRQTDTLIAHLADLQTQIRDIRLAPQRLLNGIARLAFEVGDSKADGGESRVSGTSLNDMQSNAEGIDLAYRVIFADAVEDGDPQLAAAVRATIARLKAAVKSADLRTLDLDRLRADTEELVALLQSAAPKIGLAPPTLEETAQ
jgi:iron uptake system EfeUOB component EfeO/EfeM